MKLLTPFLIVILLLVGCQTQSEDYRPYYPTKVGLPYDKESKNIAALFTMTNESGRRENLQMMTAIFEDKELGFEVQSHHNKPSKYIYGELTKLAEEVGEYGTLLIYLNSHGGGSGDRFGMSSSDGSFKFSKAMDAIAEGNQVKRLIVLIDTCHASGGIQEGFESDPIPVPNAKTGLPELPDLYSFEFNGNAYEEVLVIASSSVEDLSIRGAFASRLKKAYQAAKGQDMTIAEFMRSFAALHSNTRQKPHYKALPDDGILDEPLFRNALIRDIPIVDRNRPPGRYPPDYIPIPKAEQ